MWVDDVKKEGRKKGMSKLTKSSSIMATGTNHNNNNPDHHAFRMFV